MLANPSVLLVTCFMVVTNAAFIKTNQSVSNYHSVRNQAARSRGRTELEPTKGNQNTSSQGLHRGEAISEANLLQKSRRGKMTQSSEQVDPVIAVIPDAAHRPPALRHSKLAKSIKKVDEAVVRGVPFQWTFNGVLNQTFAHIGSFLVRDANSKVNIDSISRSDLQAVQDAKHTDDFNVGNLFEVAGDFILWIILACLMVFGGS